MSTAASPTDVCVNCGYNMVGVPLAEPCPECGRERGTGLSGGVASCISCGYELTGLPDSGACPECGTSVAKSLLGDLLAYRSPAYVERLRKGLTWILYGILVQLVLLMVGIVGAITLPLTTGWLSIGVTGVATLTTLAILLGWWWFTEADPGIDTDNEPRARRITRAAVVVGAAVAILELLVELVGVPGGLGGGGGISPTVVVAIMLAIAGLAAFVTQFIAGMLYVRGLATRLPSRKVYRLSKSRIWLCPIFYTVGVVLIGLGPLIALILYWNFLNLTKKEIVRVQKEQHQLPGI